MKPRLLCLTGYLLIFLSYFVVLVENAAVLLPFGVSEGDQLLSLASSSSGTAAATTLPQPFIFFERQHSELFISEDGAISFSAPIKGPQQELDAEKKDIIAVFYAPSTNGSVFYRSSHGGSPLSKEISAKIRRAFFTDANTFEAESVVLITWENEQQGGTSATRPGHNNTYQLALATDSKNSYAVFLYHKIGWAAASPEVGQQQKYAQAGFFSADGRTEKFVNSGTRAVTDLTKITNFLEPGLFLYRVSGSHPQDPRHNGVASLNAETEEEYIYQDAEGEYDPDEPITDCPSDPFRDHCPPHCNVVTDDRDCSLCICSSMVSENIGNSPSYSKVSPNHSPSGVEPVVDDQSAVNIDSNPEGNEVSVVDEAVRQPSVAAAAAPPPSLTSQSAVPASPTSSRTVDLSCDPQSHGQCHAKADCTHFEQAENSPAGYCCECRPDHYGNGVECLPKDGPQRINGVFEAVINGKAIEKTDLFAYVQVQDGQQHTALARIPTDVGYSLALLDAIGNGMGWLFAKHSSASPNISNGFQLTGGSFNRTVNIHLGDRYAIAIKQQFTDREFRDAFAVNIFVSGTLPELTTNSKATITFPSFEETYRRERAGVIRAYNERHITIKEEGMEEKEYRVTTDQQIHYKECYPKVNPIANEQVVRFERISAQFNAEEGVVRFASQALAGPLPSPPFNGNAIGHGGHYSPNNVDPNDPCAVGAHYCTQPNMVCRARQTSYSCECQSGYHFERDTSLEAGFRCVASNHTSSAQAGLRGGCSGHHECHQWGECVAQQCKCRGWYVGDGVHHCGPPEETIQPHLPVDTVNMQTQACGEYTCDTNADCIGAGDNQSSKNCVCRIGYTGNGITCAPSGTVDRSRVSYEHSPSISIGTICRGDNQCGVNARCVYNAQVNYYRCECLPSYTADGVDCSQEISGTSSEKSCEYKLRCHSQAKCVANGTQPICQCNEGFFGDGKTCVVGGSSIIVEPAVPQQQSEQCQDQSNCHPSAHCVQVENTNQYKCHCLPGYEGDGIRTCVHAEECSPSNSQSCAQNSKCLFSSNNQKFTCQCDQGYTRHNVQCLPSAPATDQAFLASSICSRCALDARCEQQPSSRQWSCVCNPGYSGNGYVCQQQQPPKAPTPNCLDNRSLCSAYAQCVPNEQQTTYVCNCNYGYRGNGVVCEPVLSQQQEESILLIGRGMSLIQRSTNLEVPGKQLVVVPHQVVVGIAYDCHSKQIFWSDISGHTIRSAALNGTGLNSSYSNELRSPEGIAIDWSSRNLYYVDSIRNELGVVSLEKNYQKAMLTEGLVNPRALVIDMYNRHLYYSDWHRENPHIGRIDLDGSNNQVFVSQEVHLPNALVLLSGRKELCWVDAGSHSGPRGLGCHNDRFLYRVQLSCIGQDGNNRRAVYAPLEYPFGLTCFQEQRFYWTDWNDHKIHSISIYGDSYSVFAPGAGGKGKIYGILSLPVKCHEPPTACAINNGGCPHLCLPSVNGGVVCKCPDNVTDLDGC